jgi:hypothetical protein
MPGPTRTRFSRRSQGLEQSERQELMSSLAHTRTLINQAYGSFNCVSDSDLIDSYVYEINALQSRYNYLLRRVKELEGAP